MIAKALTALLPAEEAKKVREELNLDASSVALNSTGFEPMTTAGDSKVNFFDERDRPATSASAAAAEAGYPVTEHPPSTAPGSSSSSGGGTPATSQPGSRAQTGQTSAPGRGILKSRDKT